MQNIILGLITLVAAAGATMTGIGLLIGLPLFLLACFLVFKGILQLGWGAAKLGAKGAMAGAQALKSKSESN
jgi:hypothetical protein